MRHGSSTSGGGGSRGSRARRRLFAVALVCAALSAGPTTTATAASRQVVNTASGIAGLGALTASALPARGSCAVASGPARRRAARFLRGGAAHQVPPTMGTGNAAEVGMGGSCALGRAAVEGSAGVLGTAAEE